MYQYAVEHCNSAEASERIYRPTKQKFCKIAVVSSDELLITDVQSALDLVMTVKHETGCTNIALNKEAVVNDFIRVSR